MRKKFWITKSLPFLLLMLFMSLLSCSGGASSTASPTPAAPLSVNTPTKFSMVNCDQAIQLIQQGKVQLLTIFVNASSKIPEAAQLSLVEGTPTMLSPLAASCEAHLRTAVQQENKKLPANQQIQVIQQQVAS